MSKIMKSLTKDRHSDIDAVCYCWFSISLYEGEFLLAFLSLIFGAAFSIYATARWSGG